MDGDVDWAAALLECQGHWGKAVCLFGFPRPHLGALGRLPWCVELEQARAVSSSPPRPPGRLVGRQKEHGQARRGQGDSKGLWDGPHSQT